MRPSDTRENVPPGARGQEYGSGSSRDWAAKGTFLLGVRFVLAESYERIHRSNLVGMGVLPLEYVDGQSAASLGLDGHERFTIRGIAGGVEPHQRLTVEAAAAHGGTTVFDVLARIDSPADAEYLRHGGSLPLVLRRMLAAAGATICSHEQRPARQQRASPHLRTGIARAGRDQTRPRGAARRAA
jgi:aconitate hydratase